MGKVIITHEFDSHDESEELKDLKNHGHYVSFYHEVCAEIRDKKKNGSEELQEDLDKMFKEIFEEFYFLDQ